MVDFRLKTIPASDCLNTIRLLAALQVVWCHAIRHLHLVGIVPESLFFHGIPTFFSLSGFLIWQSIGRSHTFKDYAAKRLLRIYPELWVAVLVEILAILLLYRVSEIRWSEFFVFAVGQSTVYPFWVPDCLRGYGCGTPNGALWSIFALVQFYVLAYPIYKLLHGRAIKAWIVAVVAFLCLGSLFGAVRWFFPENIRKLGEISAVPTFWMFLVGAMLAEYRETVVDKLVKFWYVPVVIRLGMLMFKSPDLYVPHYGLLNTLTCLTAAIGIGYRFPMLNIRKDISYGMYVYHMTVINAMIALGFVDGGYLLLGICIAITCVLSYISTITVGEWSKQMKNKL